jgi:ribokinase
VESSGGAPRVVVVGDLLYDLLAKVEGEVTFGTDTFVPIRVAAGGSGANAAAWLASSGVETHFVGSVGDDPFGAFGAQELEQAGVSGITSVSWTGSIYATATPSIVASS